LEADLLCVLEGWRVGIDARRGLVDDPASGGERRVGIVRYAVPAHALWADRNAGACGLSPEAGVILTSPSLGFGSGKFGTPCERMQSENLTELA
jgi:hypothetical protein